MREILFRGKPKNKADYEFLKKMYKDNCKDGFIYGSLVISHSKYYICIMALCQINSLVDNGSTTMFEVIPETVGEYTGFKNKNGKMLFEGDIVKHTQTYDILGEVISIGVIQRSSSCGRWIIGDFSNGRIDIFLAPENYRVEVIGNIHDNPELLKG